jgi:mannose PTS system EIIA component
MARLLILAHAPLASALRAVAEHTFPELVDRVQALDVAAHEPPEQVERRARELLANGAESDPEALVLTDVFGATPANVAQRLADGARVRVLAGVNELRPAATRRAGQPRHDRCHARRAADCLDPPAEPGATSERP